MVPLALNIDSIRLMDPLVRLAYLRLHYHDKYTIRYAAGLSGCGRGLVGALMRTDSSSMTGAEKVASSRPHYYLLGSTTSVLPVTNFSSSSPL